jgi:hypothetical protein
MSALSTNISKRRSKRRRILSGWLRRRACLPPYLVRTRDGKEMPLNTWLSNALREHRENEAK